MTISERDFKTKYYKYELKGNILELRNLFNDMYSFWR